MTCHDYKSLIRKWKEIVNKTFEFLRWLEALVRIKALFLAKGWRHHSLRNKHSNLRSFYERYWGWHRIVRWKFRWNIKNSVCRNVICSEMTTSPLKSKDGHFSFWIKKLRRLRTTVVFSIIPPHSRSFGQKISFRPVTLPCRSRKKPSSIRILNALCTKCRCSSPARRAIYSKFKPQKFTYQSFRKKSEAKFPPKFLS